MSRIDMNGVEKKHRNDLKLAIREDQHRHQRKKHHREMKETLNIDEAEKPALKSHNAVMLEEETLQGLRYQMGRYCQGKKDALGPKAVQCLREILFSQTGFARASRKLRQQHENICDLNEEDYDILRGQKLLKLDDHGHVIEPTENCMNKIPMRRSLRIRDIARMSAQSIAGLFPMAEAALSIAHNPIVLVMDPNKSPFVVNMVLASISSILFNSWNVFFSNALYVSAFTPMYKIDNSCMDLHNMHPVPARFRLLGSMMSSLLCTSIYSFVLGMGTSVAGVVLVAGALGTGLATQSQEFFFSEITRVLLIEGDLTPLQRLRELFVNIIKSFMDTLVSQTSKFPSKVFGFDLRLQEISDAIKNFRAPAKKPIKILSPGFLAKSPGSPGSPGEEDLVNYISERMSEMYATYCPDFIKNFGYLADEFKKYFTPQKATLSDKLGITSFFDSVKTSGMFNPQSLTHLIGLQALKIILDKSACYTAQLMYDDSLKGDYHNKSSAQLNAYYIAKAGRDSPAALPSYDDSLKGGDHHKSSAQLGAYNTAKASQKSASHKVRQSEAGKDEKLSKERATAKKRAKKQK
jgi:hypothetical protein